MSLQVVTEVLPAWVEMAGEFLDRPAADLLTEESATLSWARLRVI